jgi:hypothetical protein
MKHKLGPCVCSTGYAYRDPKRSTDMNATLLLGALGLTLSAGIAFPQGCSCKFTNGGSKCLPRTLAFTCEDTCKADLAPGVGLLGRPEAVSSCTVTAPKPLDPATYQGLVVSARYAIEHQGRPIYTGPNSDIMLSGQALKTELLLGQDDWGQAQGRREIQDASFSNIEKATAEALGLCKARRQEALTSLSWVWGHEGQSTTVQRDADTKNYQGIRNVHNQFQRDPKVTRVFQWTRDPGNG